MDRLPTELVINILKKTDLATIYKWKYQNKRLSYIISKYLIIGELKEIRVTTDVRTAILHDGRKVTVYPEESIPESLLSLATSIKTKTVFVDRLVFNNLDNDDNLEMNFFQKSFPSLKYVKYLEISSSNCDSDYFLIWFIEQYRVKSFMMNAAKFTYINDGFWEKMLQITATVDRLSLRCETLELDEDFLNYIQREEVSYTTIDGKLSIDWSLYVIDGSSRDFVDFAILDTFLEKNEIHLSKLREHVECQQRVLQLILPNGRVQLPLPNNSSFTEWKINKWNPYCSNRALVALVVCIMVLLVVEIIIS